MGKIVIPYKPRDMFIPYHESDKRFSLTIAHRRAGKTVARINKIIKSAIECTKLNPRFGYLAPYYVQAKDIAWIYFKHYCSSLLEYGCRFNESELSITLPHNNAVIKLYGAENADRMRGLYFDGIAGDEVQDINPSVLTQVILPALADREGWFDAAGTPKGWHNLLGELYKLAENDDEWFLQVLKASETGILPQEELDRQRSLMSEDEYLQEFECSFEAAIKGAIYAKWIGELRSNDKINDRVKHDPEYPVSTLWDLGYSDTTAVWFYQEAPNEILFIDYYENNGEGIGHYCDMLKDKPYRYMAHHVPQDAGKKLMEANGRSIVEQAWKDHGVRMSIVPETTHANRHDGLRRTLPYCWFNSVNCALGLEAVISYHYEYDEDLGMYKKIPHHDWSSHAATALELLPSVWRGRKTTVRDLEKRAIETKFYKLRNENNLDRKDPYRIKPMRKR